MRTRVRWLVLLLPFVLVSCATPYVFHGVSYRTTDQAFVAIDGYYRDLTAQIPSESKPKFGPLSVVIPTKQLISDRGLFKQKSIMDPTRLTSEQRQYIIDAESRGGRAMGEMLRKRNLFADVVIPESGDPHDLGISVRKDGRTALYVAYPEQAVAVWMLQKPDGAAPLPIPIPKATSVPAELPRMMSWFGRIEEAMK